MAKQPQIKGWVAVQTAPKRAKSQGADVKSASIQTLKAKVGVDSAKAPKRGPSKLRGVYLRPTKGSDADAKLFIVDEHNRPKIAQG